MANEIDRIIQSSEALEFSEELNVKLASGISKAVIVLITDEEAGRYLCEILTFRVSSNYETFGILEAGKQVIQDPDIDT